MGRTNTSPGMEDHPPGRVYDHNNSCKITLISSLDEGKPVRLSSSSTLSSSTTTTRLNSNNKLTITETSFIDGKVERRRNSTAIIISRQGDRHHGGGQEEEEEEEGSGEEEKDAADSNNNDHAPPPDPHHHHHHHGGGGGERRRTSAVELLRRSLVSVSKSPSLNLNNNNRVLQQQQQRSSRNNNNTDGNSNDRGSCGGGGGGVRIECGDCQKKKEAPNPLGSNPTPSDSNRGDSAAPPECFRTANGTTTTTSSSSDGSLATTGAAREHVYCTVYCIVNDRRANNATTTTDAEIKIAELLGRSALDGERGREREFESGQEGEGEGEEEDAGGSVVVPVSAGSIRFSFSSSAVPEPYTLDDLVDPLSGEEGGGVGAAVRCCRVCLDDKAISPLHCCRKAVCGECLKLYVSSQVRVGRAYITCPIPECFGLLEEGLVVSHLANEEVGKYRYFLELSRLDASTKPCPHCSLFTSLTPRTPPSTKETKYKIQCSKCQFVWCFKCHAPWHDGLKCRDYRRGDKLLRHWASVVEHGQRNAQKCPQCKIHIQRTEGCDHMTCTQCNTNFCYRCGERYRHLRFFGDHTSNLSVFGCKYRYLPDKPHLRRLVRGSVCVSKLVIAPVVIVLVVVLGALSLVIGLLVFPVYYVCKRRRKQQQSQGSGRWI